MKPRRVHGDRKQAVQHKAECLCALHTPCLSLPHLLKAVALLQHGCTGRHVTRIGKKRSCLLTLSFHHVGWKSCEAVSLHHPRPVLCAAGAEEESPGQYRESAASINVPQAWITFSSATHDTGSPRNDTETLNKPSGLRPQRS